MALYAIGDLHLSHQVDKPMSIFGWKDYEERLKENWMSLVTGNDTVIIPGDFSWAMYLEESTSDFRYIDILPGKKIILKGNHDYWWETLTKMNRFLKEKEFSNIYFLHNNSYEAEGVCICGTKGWDEKEKDEKIINRETERFRISVSSVKNRDFPLLAAFHYPPYSCSPLMDIMMEYGIKKCVYGHLHGLVTPPVIISHDVECILASSDFLDFKPLRLV
jgi:uncharacterized protein